MARRQRRLLSVASECAPLIKTGGLADVVGALPAALAPHGWRTRTLLPAYPGLLAQLQRRRRLWRDGDLFGGPASVYAGKIGDLDLLLLDAPHLFDRQGGPYVDDNQQDHADNHIRFAALSWVASRITVDGLADRWRPDVVHVHDWQAGLVPSYLKYAGCTTPSVMTIHNIAFQGIFGADQLDALRLPTWDFTAEALEYHGFGSMLKAGMVHATRVTTVSPTYAEELATPEFGFGLEGVVQARRDRGELCGILNGIDERVWNPAADPAVIPYSAASIAVKQENRRALLEEFSLPDAEGPLAIVVTRLSHQKGIDLLLETLPEFIEAGGSVIVLGSGDPGYEYGLRQLASWFPDAVGLRIGYDESLSHRMFAGGDLVLVPSRFEPCGLTQMYGLRYGAVPVVSATGGLRDTVTATTATTLAEGTATGFSFEHIDTAGLRFALSEALKTYAQPEVWARVQLNGMARPLGWGVSGGAYARLFADILDPAR